MVYPCGAYIYIPGVERFVVTLEALYFLVAALEVFFFEGVVDTTSADSEPCSYTSTRFAQRITICSILQNNVAKTKRE